MDTLNEKYWKIKDDELINSILSQAEILPDFNLNNDFLKLIMQDLLESFNQLEIAIYLYIKICKLLTYDKVFFAHRQSEEVNLQHKDISNISSINEENNSVICYEITMIYAKLLQKFNIPFKIIPTEDGLIYGKGHTKLIATCDDFVISADAVKSILFGDFQRIKLGMLPDGLECQNFEPSKRHVFDEYIAKMSETLNEENKINVKKDIKNISMINNYEEKIFCLISNVLSSELKGIDMIGYMMYLCNGLLYGKIKEQVKMTIALEKDFDTLYPVIIFCIMGKPNNYIIIRTDRSLEYKNHYDLQKDFNSKKLKIFNRKVFDIVSITSQSANKKIYKKTTNN